MTIVRVIDIETTGFPDEQPAGICEVGWVDVTIRENGAHSIGEVESSLCHPGMPIPPVASAVHHIVDEDVADAPTQDEVVARAMSGADYFVAHNARFEQAFLGGDKWICTYKVALRLFQDLDSHSNQALRYLLKLPVDRKVAHLAHRAGPDAYVTAHLFCHMLKLTTGRQMFEWSLSPALQIKVGFGKHFGKRWNDLAVEAPDYLQWVLQQDFDEDVRYTASYWLRGEHANR